MDELPLPPVRCNSAMGRNGRGIPRLGGRRATGFAIAAIAAVTLTACSDDEDLKDHLSFCDVYGRMVEQRAEVQALDITSMDADDAADEVEEYLDSVRQLGEISDDRYGMQISELQAAVHDLLLTLDSVDPDAEFAIWAPLVEDDLEAARDRADVLDEAIGPSCGADELNDATES